MIILIVSKLFENFKKYILYLKFSKSFINENFYKRHFSLENLREIFVRKIVRNSMKFSVSMKYSEKNMKFSIIFVKKYEKV